MSTRSFRTLIEYAASRGSKATSRAGARRYLLANQPPPIAGLRRLTTGDASPSIARLDPRQPGWKSITHDARADRLAVELATRLSTSPAPLSAVAGQTAGLTPDMSARVDARLRELLEDLAASTIAKNWPFRRARSKWVGGSHEVHVRISDEPSGYCYSDLVWARKHRWSGRNSFAHLACTPRALELLGPGLTFHGLLCMDVEELRPRVFRIAYLKQGRGFSLVLKHGWIVCGHLQTTDSLSDARARVGKLRTGHARGLIQARSAEENLLRSIRVTVADSIRAGNCRAGTDAFRKQHPALTRTGSIRADLLLALVASREARAAVAVAQQRATHVPQ